MAGSDLERELLQLRTQLRFVGICGRKRSLHIFVVADTRNVRNGHRAEELPALRSALKTSLQLLTDFVVTITLLTVDANVTFRDEWNGNNVFLSTKLNKILCSVVEFEAPVDAPTLQKAIVTVLERLANTECPSDSIRMCLYVGNTIDRIAESPECVYTSHDLQRKGIILYFGNWDRLHPRRRTVAHELMTLMASTTGGSHRSIESASPSSIVEWLLNAVLESVKIVDNVPHLWDNLVVASSGSNKVVVEDLSFEIQRRFSSCHTSTAYGWPPGSVQAMAWQVRQDRHMFAMFTRQAYQLMMGCDLVENYDACFADESEDTMGDREIHYALVAQATPPDGFCAAAPSFRIRSDVSGRSWFVDEEFRGASSGTPVCIQSSGAPGARQESRTDRKKSGTDRDSRTNSACESLLTNRVLVLRFSTGN